MKVGGMQIGLARDVRIWLALPALMVAILVFSSAAPATAQARCKGVRMASDKGGKEKLRDAVKCLVNKRRSGKNLRENENLEDAAQYHSNFMKKRSCFAHVCSGEAGLGTRISRTGYFRGSSSHGYGETIALNSDKATPHDIVKQFMNSPPHRALLMGGKFKHLGVGITVSSNRAWYTIDLGYKRG